MKSEYENAYLEVVGFWSEDVIVTSGDDETEIIPA